MESVDGYQRVPNAIQEIYPSPTESLGVEIHTVQLRLVICDSFRLLFYQHPRPRQDVWTRRFVVLDSCQLGFYAIDHLLCSSLVSLEVLLGNNTLTSGKDLHYDSFWYLFSSRSRNIPKAKAIIFVLPRWRRSYYREPFLELQNDRSPDHK